MAPLPGQRVQPLLVPVPSSSMARPSQANAQSRPSTFQPSERRAPKGPSLCPLCIEELDETDSNFYPCPCGYQVCLFCYGQVKEKCNSLCPGCRREYGEPVDPSCIIRQQDDSDVSDSAAASTPPSYGHGPSFPPASHSQPRPQSYILVRPETTQAVRGGPPQTILKPSNPTSRPPLGATQGRPTDPYPPSQPAFPWTQQQGRPTDPYGSNQQFSRHSSSENIDQEQLQRVNVEDSSAWPSLADATSAPPPQPQPQPQPGFRGLNLKGSTPGLGGGMGGGHASEGSSESDSSSFPDQGLAPYPQHIPQHSPHSVKGPPPGFAQSAHPLAPPPHPPHPPHPLQSTLSTLPPHLQEHFSSAHIVTLIDGVRHSVLVPLSDGDPPIKPFPEASALKQQLQGSIANGTLSHKEAAAHLLSLLTQHKGPSHPPPATIASIPPGFKQPAAASNSTSTFSFDPAPALSSSSSPASAFLDARNDPTLPFNFKPRGQAPGPAFPPPHSSSTSWSPGLLGAPGGGRVQASLPPAPSPSPSPYSLWTTGGGLSGIDLFSLVASPSPPPSSFTSSTIGVSLAPSTTFPLPSSSLNPNPNPNISPSSPPSLSGFSPQPQPQRQPLPQQQASPPLPIQGGSVPPLPIQGGSVTRTIMTRDSEPMSSRGGFKLQALTQLPQLPQPSSAPPPSSSIEPKPALINHLPNPIPAVTQASLAAAQALMHPSSRGPTPPPGFGSNVGALPPHAVSSLNQHTLTVNPGEISTRSGQQGQGQGQGLLSPNTTALAAAAASQAVGGRPLYVPLIQSQSLSGAAGGQGARP